MTRSLLEAVGWSGLEAACAAGLSVASALFVARMIGPSELGIGAAAVSVHVLLWVVVNALFGDALVQRPSMDDEACASALWTSVAIGCLAALVQASAGWVLAALLDDRRLPAMGLSLALPLPLVGAAGVMQGRLTRARGYGRLAGRTILGQGLGTAVGIGAAFHGAGAWATVGQQFVTSFAGALALIAGSRWRPALVWHWHPVREMLGVGVPLTASTLAQHARYRLFAILIGGTAGPTALGEVHIAFRLIDTVRELSFTALWRLMLPILSERQNSRRAVLDCMDRCLSVSSAIMLPVCAGMAMVLEPLVLLVLGPRWAVAGEGGLPLIGLMAVMVLTFPSGVALVAIGRARLTLYANLAAIGLTAVGVVSVGPTNPLACVLVWCGSQILTLPYTLHVNAGALGVGCLRPLRAGFPMLLVSLGALAAAWVLPALMLKAPDPVSLVGARLPIWLAAVAAGGLILLVRHRHAAAVAISTRD
jgi:PST family polysaccharide transporter